MPENLLKYILTTLAYYDVMDYPMTAFEIWKHLTQVNGQEGNSKKKYNITDIIRELENEKLKRFIDEYWGFYFLKGRKDLVDKRLKCNKISQEKMKIARRIAKCLRFIPYVRMVAITGSLAMKNSNSVSDIDFLVVLKHGKIFTGRLLVTLIVHLLGRRRYGEKINNRVCLNYFITTKTLEINLKDIFSASEYSFIFPIFGFNIFRKFKEANCWIERYKINYQTNLLANLKIVRENKTIKFIRKSGEKILDFSFIEEYLKKWQIGRIVSDPRTHKPGSVVIANDEMLVFLPEPQGPGLYVAFQKKLNGLA